MNSWNITNCAWANVGGEVSTCRLAWTCPIWASLGWACSACSWTGGALGSGPLSGPRWGARWCELLPWAKKNLELIILDWRKVWTQTGTRRRWLTFTDARIQFVSVATSPSCCRSAGLQFKRFSDRTRKFFLQIRCSCVKTLNGHTWTSFTSILAHKWWKVNIMWNRFSGVSPRLWQHPTVLCSDNKSTFQLLSTPSLWGRVCVNFLPELKQHWNRLQTDF